MSFHHDFTKTADEDAQVRRTLAFIGGQEKLVQQSFIEIVAHIRETLLPEVQDLFAAARYNRIPLLIDEPFQGLSDTLRQVFANAGNYEMAALYRAWEIQRVEKIDVSPSIDLSFNPGDPEAARLLTQQLMALIREITDAQKRLIAAALRQARELGLGAVEASRMFRDSIGLTEYQLSIVDGYRRALQSGSSDALSRVLRDRRFDSTVGAAIRRGTVLDAAQIDRMVGRYQERMIAMRAETIARTETQVVVNQARYAALNQMATKAGVPFNRIVRRWRTVIDGRERHTHHAMNGQRRGLKERFVSPSGAKLMFPGDRSSAPASEVINCRCVVLTRLMSPEEAARAEVLAAPRMPRQGAIVTPPVRGNITNVAPPLTFDTGRIGGGFAFESDFTLVYADVEALDAGWLKGSKDLYRQRGLQDEMARIRAAADAKTPLPVPYITLDETGAIVFKDGRLRYAYARDFSKQQYIPVAVPKEQAAKFKRRFQYKEPEPAGKPVKPTKPVKMTWDNWIDDSKLTEGENYLNWLKTFLGRAKRRELTTTSELMRSASWSMHARDLGLTVKEDLRRWSKYFSGEASQIFKELSETYVEMTKSVYLNKIADADRLLVRANMLAEKLLAVAPGQASKLATQQIRYLYGELKPKGIIKPVKPPKKPVAAKPKTPAKKPKAPAKKPAKPKAPVKEPVKPKEPKVPKGVQAVEDDIKVYGQAEARVEPTPAIRLDYKSADPNYRSFAKPSFEGANDLARDVINKAGSVDVEFSLSEQTAYFGKFRRINLSGMGNSAQYRGSQAIFRHEYGHYIDHVMQRPDFVYDYTLDITTQSPWSSAKLAKQIVAQHEKWVSTAVKKTRQLLNESDFYAFMKEKYGVSRAALGLLGDSNSLGARYLRAYIRKFETETGFKLDDLGMASDSWSIGLLNRAAVVRALETGNIEAFVKFLTKSGGPHATLGLSNGNRMMLHDFIASVTRLEHGHGHSAQYYAKGKTVLGKLRAVKVNYRVLGAAPTLTNPALHTVLTNLHCTEAFADWFSLYTQGPSERALLRMLAPELNETFEDLLKEFSRQKGALNKDATRH